MGQPALLTPADTKRYKDQIPYLGAEPPPSRPLGLALQVASGVTAAALLLRAAAYGQRAGLDSQLTAVPDSRLAEQIRTNASMVTLIDRGVLLLLVVTCGVSIAWTIRRRPRDLRTRAGEAYVESPLGWAWPPTYRIPHILLIVAAVAANAQGAVSRTTPASALPAMRGWSALAAVLFALYWAGCVPMVVVVNQEHLRRLAWSWPYREQPASVPFFPPVAGSSMGSTNSSVTTNENEGCLWWLRTAGLLTLLLIGSLFGIIGIADVAAGKSASLPFALVGVAMAAVAIGLLWRRYRRKQAAGSPPPSGMPWG